MTVSQFLGCGMIAFGPSIAMFVLTIAHDPVRIIMLVASAFVWLLALLCSSLIYNIFYYVISYIGFTAIISVIIQEVFRYLWFRLLKRAEIGLRKVSDNIQIVENKHILAYVSGLGFGIMSGIFSLLNLLADMTGPGIVGLHGEPQNFFVISSVICTLFIFLQIFTSLLFFDALHRNLPYQFIFSIFGHLFCTGITLAKPVALVLPFIVIYTTICGVVTFRVLSGSLEGLKEAIRRKPEVVQVNGNTVRDGI